ncbi:hypothetical protein BN133_3902 [Cronobacter dublinensis 582]|nr:hypothetical protein BN133_3902 [Cronobacter dublinensis 582]
MALSSPRLVSVSPCKSSVPPVRSAPWFSVSPAVTFSALSPCASPRLCRRSAVSVSWRAASVPSLLSVAALSVMALSASRRPRLSSVAKSPRTFTPLISPPLTRSCPCSVRSPLVVMSPWLLSVGIVRRRPSAPYSVPPERLSSCPAATSSACWLCNSPPLVMCPPRSVRSPSVVISPRLVSAGRSRVRLAALYSVPPLRLSRRSAKRLSARSPCSSPLLVICLPRSVSASPSSVPLLARRSSAVTRVAAASDLPPWIRRCAVTSSAPFAAWVPFSVASRAVIERSRPLCSCAPCCVVTALCVSVRLPAAIVWPFRSASCEASSRMSP